MPQAPHKPTDKLRDEIERLSSVGIPQDDIALMVGITSRTMRKYYRDELDVATSKANASVAGTLFKKAMDGDTTCMIFWLKTRAKWNDRPDEQRDDKPIIINIVKPDGN